jgi:hypothetical protein
MNQEFETITQVLKAAEHLMSHSKIEDTIENRCLIGFYLDRLINECYQTGNRDLSRRVMKYFLKIERKIHSTSFFWGLFRLVWANNESGVAEFVEEIEKAIHRYDRLNCTLEERIRMARELLPNEDSSTTEILELPDEITAYRGFFVRGNDDIRVNRKSKSPTAHIQKAGKGISFTLKPSVAHLFAEYSTFRNGKDGGSLKRKKKFARTTDKDAFVWEHFLKKGSPTVGSFVINKEDIILYIAEREEDEILCFPDKAKLQRYDILKPDQILAAFKKGKQNTGQLEIACEQFPFLKTIKDLD